MKQLLIWAAVFAVFWLWGAGHKPAAPPVHHPATAVHHT